MVGTVIILGMSTMSLSVSGSRRTCSKVDVQLWFVRDHFRPVRDETITSVVDVNVKTPFNNGSSTSMRRLKDEPLFSRLRLIDSIMLTLSATSTGLIASIQPSETYERSLKDEYEASEL